MEESSTCYERALADVELLQAAYPDEISVDRKRHDGGDGDDESDSVPAVATLHLSKHAFVVLEFPQGYPVQKSIEIVSYRTKPHEKARMEAALMAIRSAAASCLKEQMEAGLECCAAAMEAWTHAEDAEREQSEALAKEDEVALGSGPADLQYKWITGEPLLDRKSVFQAFACSVKSEQQVHEALHQLLDGNSKLQRATHNMYAYRLTEALSNGTNVQKFDNDDDGEDGAGSRLAQLLEMRKEDGVVVLVSRWYGGILLGPKRFAHITNVARELLVACHAEHWNNDTG